MANDGYLTEADSNAIARESSYTPGLAHEINSATDLADQVVATLQEYGWACENLGDGPNGRYVKAQRDGVHLIFTATNT